ncbi:MAG: class I SAM-dependent methyltransferase family protein [Thermofilaceae archaeon]|nr:class I SAM-dependent methyltransferase family protein [Thermofilaceae archaeon]
MSLRERLRVLGEDVRYVPSSFEIIGSRGKAVAILEFPEEAPEHVKMKVAEAVMKVNRNVKTVLAKGSERKGAFRLREYELLAGEENTEVIHVEHGVRLKLDPRKVYFSSREATERVRVASQVKPGEFVMVMFAGVGPYALMIAKKQPLVEKVVAIELNPDAYNYMVENILLNKVEGKVLPVLGDVKAVARNWYSMCDRVVMPLPKGAHMFLNEAFNCIRPEGGTIHFYHWASEYDLYSEAYLLLEREAYLKNRSVKIVDARIVSEYAPRIYKICVDVFIKSSHF